MKLSGLKSNHFSTILAGKIPNRVILRRFSGTGLAAFLQRPQTQGPPGNFWVDRTAFSATLWRSESLYVCQDNDRRP